MAYRVEVTDTFGGEANYSWVRRYEIGEPKCEWGRGTQRGLVVRAKRAAGWQGIRTVTESCGYGDLTVRPAGRNAPCWVMFINAIDN